MALNINRNVDDVFYRYKMPKLVAKVEGKGNGIKTVIANMTDIAKALNRPPTYSTKYFGCELGAQTQFDLKNDRYIVNGEHDANKLQDVLDGFIKRFVLCQGCDNPETTLKVKKNNTIQQTCKACGLVGWIDMKHKLTSFIVKNPPPEDTADSAAGRKGVKASTETGEDQIDAGIVVDSVDVVNGANHVNGPTMNDEEEEEWVPVQLDDEAKKEAMSGNLAKLVVTEDLELSKDERLDKYYEWLKKFKSNNKDTYISKAKEIHDEAQRLEVKEKASLLLVKVFISPDSPIESIKNHQKILARFTIDSKRAQKYLLGGIEVLVAGDDKTRAKLIPMTPVILKSLYDVDIVEEEALLDWSKKATKKYVKKEHSQAMIDAAAPLIKWLQEAEEETSDEDDEDDTKIEFTNKEKQGLHKKEEPVARKDSEESKSDDKDEDLDIDNI